jgi:hypothetical protein
MQTTFRNATAHFLTPRNLSLFKRNMPFQWIRLPDWYYRNEKPVHPSEIKPVLEALASTKAVIIGGQAVNLWAEHYQKDSSPWKELRPYTSFDLDVLGNRSPEVQPGIERRTLVSDPVREHG